MGEIAEMMLNGTLCEGCGVYLGGGTSGFTSRCSSCSREAKAITKADNIARSAAKQAASKKIRCTVCNKRVSTVGMADHMRDVHGGAKAPASMSLTTTPTCQTMAQREETLRQWHEETADEPEMQWLEKSFEDMADIVNKARFCASADDDMTPDNSWMARQDAHEARRAA